MGRSLERILRLRTLLEEESRLRLERSVLEAGRIEQRRKAERQLASACWFSAFSLADSLPDKENDSSDFKPKQEEWLAAVREGELAARRELQLQPLMMTAMRSVEAEREEMLELRLEREQVETLLHNQAALCESERERSSQRNLDDWYAAALYRRTRFLAGRAAKQA